jgi:gamma-glutamyl phosphate reductase
MSISELKLAKAKIEAERTALVGEAKHLATRIRTIIQPAAADIEELEISRAATLMDELVLAQGRLLSLRSKLWEIERELA